MFMKMKYLILVLSFLAFVGCDINNGSNQSGYSNSKVSSSSIKQEPIQEAMPSTANHPLSYYRASMEELKSRLPMVVDQVTNVTAVKMSGKTIIYEYNIDAVALNQILGESGISMSEYRNNMQNAANQSLYNFAQDWQEDFVTYGFVFEHRYYRSDNHKLMFEFVVKP